MQNTSPVHNGAELIYGNFYGIHYANIHLLLRGDKYIYNYKQQVPKFSLLPSLAILIVPYIDKFSGNEI
jgi:hypothetical protein